MIARISIFFLGLVSFLCAQEEPSVLPEPSEPPFKVGDLPLESGYIIERKGAPDLNFRIVENQMRLYWIDDDGLIMEPEVPAVSVRFDERDLRETTRSFHRLQRLSGDTALGSPYILPVPHRYFITVLLRSPNSDELLSYRFRYTPEMDEVAPKESD